MSEDRNTSCWKRVTSEMQMMLCGGHGAHSNHVSLQKEEFAWRSGDRVCAHFRWCVGRVVLFGARGGGGTSHEKPTVPHQAQHHSTAQSPPFQISQRPCHLWYRHSAEEERYVRNKNDWDCHDAVSRNAQHKPEEEGIHSLRMWCGSSIPCVGVNAANEAA